MALVEPQLSVRAEEAIFPQELVDYTIDFLHDDYESLKGCTLVSHTWLPSSRFHLFSHRYIDVGAPDLYDFLAWARSCEFGPQYVRSVEFVGSGEYISIRKAPLVDLLTCLPHIEALIFLRARFESDDASASKELQCARRSDPAMRRFALKHLWVSESCDPDSRYFNLATCLGIFKSIGSLGIWWMKNLGLQAMTLLTRSLPPIDEFIIPNDTSIPLVRIYALTVASTPQCIQSLDIGNILHGCTPYKTGMLLKHVGAGLRRLSLELFGLDEPRDIALLCAQLNLSACTRLENVFLGALRSPLSESFACQSVARLIGSIPCTTLKRISLCLCASPDAATTTLDRDKLDDVLTRFSALRELQVYVLCSSKIDSEVGKIWKAWPLTARKANIIVTFL